MKIRSLSRKPRLKVEQTYLLYTITWQPISRNWLAGMHKYSVFKLSPLTRGRLSLMHLFTVTSANIAVSHILLKLDSVH